MFSQRKLKPFNPFGVEVGKITESDKNKQFGMQIGSQRSRIPRKQQI